MGCATSVRSLLWAVATALVLSGCSSASYRRSADKEAYGIIQHVEKQVTGHTNEFTIETAYSARKPADIMPSELIEDRLQTNRRVLTIDEALDLAVKNSREYQTAKEVVFKAALNLSDERYAAGPSFNTAVGASAVADRATSGRQSGSVTLGSPYITDNANKLGFSTLFKTGGRLSVDLLNSIMLYYSGKPELAFSKISGSLVQPLWRGFGKNSQAVENLTQAERDMVYAVRNFINYQDGFAVNIINDYFGLLAQKESIRNRYTNYLGRVESTKRLEARANDREKLADVDQARQSELSAKNLYVNAVAAYFNSLDRFKIKLGIPVGEKLFLDDQALHEMEQNGLVPAPLDPDEGFRLAVQRQMRVLNEIDRFEDAKRKVRIAADKLKPGLNLVADASLRSEGSTDYTKFNPDKYEAGVGLLLDLPLDRVPLANTYRSAVIDFEFKLRTFTRAMDDLKESIDSGLRTLEQRRQSYEIQKNAVKIADRRVESTTLLLKAGRAEVRDVVDASDAQIATQNAELLAMVDYQQTRLQLMLDIGALDAETSKFWLKDHLAAFLPGGTPAAAQPESTEKAVREPEHYFNN